MGNEAYETLSWPTNLDHAAIVVRLVKLREQALTSGLSALAANLAEVETMPTAKIGACVIAALSWLQDNPGHGSLAAQFEMLAVNLKNL